MSRLEARRSRSPKELAAVQHLHGDLEAAPWLAEDVRERDMHVFSKYTSVVELAANAELVLVRTVLHAGPALDEKTP